MTVLTVSHFRDPASLLRLDSLWRYIPFRDIAFSDCRKLYVSSQATVPELVLVERSKSGYEILASMRTEGSSPLVGSDKFRGSLELDILRVRMTLQPILYALYTGDKVSTDVRVPRYLQHCLSADLGETIDLNFLKVIIVPTKLAVYSTDVRYASERAETSTASIG
jgi:hypothetical protein